MAEKEAPDRGNDYDESPPKKGERWHWSACLTYLVTGRIGPARQVSRQADAITHALTVWRGIPDRMTYTQARDMLLAELRRGALKARGRNRATGKAKGIKGEHWAGGTAAYGQHSRQSLTFTLTDRGRSWDAVTLPAARLVALFPPVENEAPDLPEPEAEPEPVREAEPDPAPEPVAPDVQREADRIMRDRTAARQIAAMDEALRLVPQIQTMSAARAARAYMEAVRKGDKDRPEGEKRYTRGGSILVNDKAASHLTLIKWFKGDVCKELERACVPPLCRVGGREGPLYTSLTKALKERER